MWRYLRLTTLQAEYRTERACVLPEYLGSTLRGALGQELRTASCVDRDSPCTVCPRPDRCAVGALFDDPAVIDAVSSQRQLGEEGGQASGQNAGGFDRPRPYILAPPPRRRGNYASGETIRFGVTLVGRARIWFPWVVAAMTGIGRARHQRRATALVASANRCGPSRADLIEFEPATLGVGQVLPELDATRIVADGPPATSQAIVALVTPADLKQKGRRLDQLDGPTFFRRLIRRIGTLVETYGNPPPDAREFDYRALASLADQVVVQDQQVSVQSWERYSGRLDAKHPLSGLVGQALLTGIPEGSGPT